MKILLWHVHGAWTTAFVQGEHEYVVPLLPGRPPDGRGRARTYEWPEDVAELEPAALGELELDVVIAQRPHELELSERWLRGRRPGRDLPCVYVEHNAPQGRIADMRHPLADRPELQIVHVTHFNDLFWDCGSTPTRVIEHGIVDPGPLYSGELARAGVVVNEARRRGRVTGTDLLGRFAAAAPIDLFGIDASDEDGTVSAIGDLPHAALHAELARRRVYLHPIRWTSLGLALLEAMHLAMPVVALATTEVVEAVPPEAGVVSTDLDALVAALAELVADPALAARMGTAARAAALRRYGLERFLADWDAALGAVAGHAPVPARATV